MAKARGLRIVPGYLMLLHQAVSAYEKIFMGKLDNEDIAVMREAMLSEITPKSP